MSGHSKWATIKHAKGAADAKRGQLFTKFIKEISIAARMGGGDPNANPRLRTAILKARAANMPKDNISANPGDFIFFMISAESNNFSASLDVRNIFNKSGGNLGATGSVSYMFKRKGVIEYDGEKYTEDQIMEIGLDVGAEDVSSEDGVITVTTDPADFASVLEALQEKGLESVSAEIQMVPDTYTSVDADTTAKVMKLIDRLEENDDVQNVYSNIDIPDDYQA